MNQLESEICRILNVSRHEFEVGHEHPLSISLHQQMGGTVWEGVRPKPDTSGRPGQGQFGNRRSAPTWQPKYAIKGSGNFANPPNASLRGGDEPPATSEDFVTDEFSSDPASEGDRQYIKRKFRYNGGRGHFSRKFVTG